MGFEKSKHQVAGHAGSVVSDKEMFNTGIFAKKSGDQEIRFYQQLLLDDNDDDLVGNVLIDWVPRYMGTLTENEIVGDFLEIQSHIEKININTDTINAPITPTDDKYVVLSNLYYDFINPNILDIKLGALLTDESASAEKIERLKKVSESTTSGSLNFRICGMKLYNGKSDIVPDLTSFGDQSDNINVETDDIGDKYISFNKFFGRSLTKDNIPQALTLFFNSPKPELTRHYYDVFLKRLQLLYNCLLNYEVRMISASLLFITENSPTVYDLDYEEYDPLIYEEEEDENENENENENEQHLPSHVIKKLSSLHLIDFAHSKFVKGKGPDDNILTGIENLISIFQHLLDNH